MANDAGFAAAVTIRQQVLHDKLTATYANGQFPTTLNYPLLGGPPDASISLFLGEPDIACEGATNLLVVTVPVWGGVTVTETVPVTVQIKGLIEVTLVPDFQLITASDGTQTAQLNPATTIAVRTWTATVTSADPPPDVASYVTGDMFRVRLQTEISLALLTGIISLPQIPIDYLHGIPAFVAENGISSVAVDGALLLGFAVESDSPTGPLQGDVTALTDFAGSFALAAFVNPLAAPLFFSDVQDALSSAASSQGATLDTGSLSVTLADGHAHVTGKLDATGGTLNFSFDILPHMENFSGPGAEWVAYTTEHWVDDPRVRLVKPRSWPALWFTTGNAQSEVDASWWVDALEVLTVGFLLLVFLPKFSNAEGSFDNKVDDRPPNAPYPRVQHTAAPAGGIVLRIALDSFELAADGISVGVHESAKPTTIAVTGPAIIPSSYATEVLHYTLRLPSGALPADPTLRVAWTLTDATSGVVLASEDDKVADPSPGFEFQPSSFVSTSKFEVQGRLYRLFGTETADVGSAATSLQVRGALAPAAYVSWRAQSVKPRVGFDTTSGLWQYGGDAHVQRQSKWHRTDAPCQAASKGVNYAGRYEPQYANTLPFHLKDLVQSRQVLCDYCFFGGPAGTNARL
ncbi:hypothetical protein [Terriglobus saanensis]|uniref:Uncharacterized protein n=1 Tax=Terriglobus saanensis (strain ATCC BAA-1853 / DSM 23119 / SP1PR4) TaxID=401053 RepID=E8UY93_TERSS|nr:hypothetical protein [Terriglobus saanensis]ADV80903.1 hypothetical protein AciPR4_0062 [Terriglobus saanensis SP1PR4]